MTLVDPVEEQIAKAERHGTFSAEVGDARQLRFADDSFDVALLFGPLYHLQAQEDRLTALREAVRVVAPGGWVFAAAIPRFIHHAAVSLGRETPRPYPSAWLQVLESGTPQPGGRFPAGHFHTAAELHDELDATGLTAIELHAIEGPAGLALEQLPSDDALLQAALTLVRRTGHLPATREMTNHLMAIARVPAIT